MGPASRHHDSHGDDILKDVATPQLYLHNAFRVLGLSVTVDGAEMARQQKRLELMGRFGDNTTQTHAGILPLVPPPDAEVLRAAGQRLHNMPERLVDELFWIWPGDYRNGDTDAAYKAACEGRLHDAHQLWFHQTKDPATEAAAVHNLAVVHHALALDLEDASTTGEVDDEPRATQPEGRRDKYWAVALNLWSDFLEDERGWRYIRSRAEVLDDPRLNSRFVSQLRQSLPEAILSINIGLAVRAARRGDVDEARRHLLYIRNSRFDLQLAISLLERRASPMVEQVRRICDPVSERSKASPRTADQLAHSVLSECHILLTGIRALLETEHHLRQAAFDLVASTVRDCTIDYGNATQNWEGCVPLLKHAAVLALDDNLQSRLRKDVEQVKEMQAEEQRVEELKKAVTGDHVYEVNIPGSEVRMADLCTCCLEPATQEQPVEYAWEETRGITRYKRSLSFKFPICDGCRKHQAEHVRKRAILIVMAVVSSVGTGYAVAGELEKPEWLHFVLAGGALTFILTLLFSALLRLQVLTDEHACRDQAVTIRKASDSHVEFHFHNPIYAEVFARSNGVAVTPRKTRKPPRGAYILAGNGAVLSLVLTLLLGGIGHSIIYAAKEDHWQRSPSHSTVSHAPSRTSMSSRSEKPSRPSSTSRSYAGLSRRIDAAKARARELESEVNRIDSHIESLSSQITRYKREIEAYETQARSGFPINQYSYQQALADHNRLVRQYNALLGRRNTEYRSYQEAIDSANSMVDRYNRGER